MTWLLIRFCVCVFVFWGNKINIGGSILTSYIVGGQNRSPNLFLGSEPHFRALAWMGVKWENDARFTVVDRKSTRLNSSGAWERVELPMTTIFQGFVDRAMIYPMVEVVAQLDARKLEFWGSQCLAELGSSEIAPVHAIMPGNAVPTDGANVGDQNSSS